MKDSYILGGGIAGLISGYITGYPVICDGPLGGQLKSTFPLGPRILESTEDTAWLLHKLGIKDKPRIFTVGYEVGFKKYDLTFRGPLEGPPPGFLEDYHYKTRGTRELSGSPLSGGKNQIEGWDLYDIKLIERLSQEVSIIPKTVTGIREDHMVLCDRTKDKRNIFHRFVKIQEMISTIPLPSLYKLTGIVEEHPIDAFEAYDTVFLLVKTDGVTPITSTFDYMYNADLTYPVHRITKISDKFYVLEIRGDRYTSRNCIPEVRYCEWIPVDEVVLKRAQIVKSLESRFMLGSIYLVGRYAQWNHSIKIEDVIRRVRDIASR